MPGPDERLRVGSAVFGPDCRDGSLAPFVDALFPNREPKEGYEARRAAHLERLEEAKKALDALEDKQPQQPRPDPFVVFDTSGGLVFCAVKTHQGVVVSGSGGALDSTQIARLREWLEAKPGDPLPACPEVRS